MFNNKKQEPNNELENTVEERKSIFKKNEKNVKSLIAPGGIDASYTTSILQSITRAMRKDGMTRHSRCSHLWNLAGETRYSLPPRDVMTGRRSLHSPRVRHSSIRL